MKYVIIDQIKDGDLFNKEFDCAEHAIKDAVGTWNSMSSFDKGRRSEFYVLDSCNPDEDSENHLDGDVIIDLISARKQDIDEALAKNTKQ